MPAGGDHRIRQPLADQLRHRDRGGVLQGRPARDDDQVGLVLGQQRAPDLEEALAADLVLGVAQLGLQVEHRRLEPCPPQLRVELHELGLDPRAVGPAAAVERPGEHEQHA